MEQFKKKGCKRLALALTLVAGGAFAQTAQMTATSTANSLFVTPATGFISATIISTTGTIAATLPTNSRTINAIMCNLRDSSGNEKNAQITVSSTTSRVIVAASGQASSTLAVNDRLNCHISYER